MGINILTCFLVKQAIALQRIIPFYHFFASGGKPIDNLGGSLMLHWIFSVIALAVVPINTDARQFAVGIYSYGYQVVNRASICLVSPFFRF
jgi:hypothetical protein